MFINFTEPHATARKLKFSTPGSKSGPMNQQTIYAQNSIELDVSLPTGNPTDTEIEFLVV